MATKSPTNDGNHGRTSTDGRYRIITLQASWDPAKKLRCSERYMKASTSVEEFLFESMKNRCTFFFRPLMEKLCNGPDDSLLVATGPSHNLVIAWTKKEDHKPALAPVVKSIYLTMEEASTPGVIMHDEHIVDFVHGDSDRRFIIHHSNAPQFEIKPTNQCRTHHCSVAYVPLVEVEEEAPQNQQKSTRSKIIEAVALSLNEKPQQKTLQQQTQKVARDTSKGAKQRFDQKASLIQEANRRQEPNETVVLRSVPRKRSVSDDNHLEQFANHATDTGSSKPKERTEMLLDRKVKGLLEKKSSDELEAAILIADMQGLRGEKSGKEEAISTERKTCKRPLDVIKRKFASRSVGRRNVLSDPALSPSKKRHSKATYVTIQTTSSVPIESTTERNSATKGKRKAEEEPELAAETLLQFKKRTPAQKPEGFSLNVLAEKGVEMIDKDLEQILTMRKLNALKNFYERAKELERYKESKGHCDVPQKYGPNPKLGVWVNKMRMEKKKYDKNEQNSLDEKKIKILDDLGFNWGSKKGDEKWEEHFQSLVEAKEKMGTPNVPTKYSINPALGRFVSTQRCEYKKFISGKKSLLDEKKIRRLEELGFCWDALVARGIGPKKLMHSETTET